MAKRKKVNSAGAFIIRGDSTRPPRRARRGRPDEALDEIVRVVDGHERGEPFGTEWGSEDLLAYIGDVARRGKG